jgi:hypothetical protein
VSRNGPLITSQGVIIAFRINAWKGRRGGGQCARIEFSVSFSILCSACSLCSDSWFNTSVRLSFVLFTSCLDHVTCINSAVLCILCRIP